MAISLTNNTISFNDGSLQSSSRFGPAFSARASVAQSFSPNIGTKVTLGTERFDTDACFASSRFTPNKAGFYHIQGTLRVAPGYDNPVDSEPVGGVFCILTKNGAEFKRGSEGINTNINQIVVHASIDTIVSLNGSTDYVELFAFFGNPDPSNYPQNNLQLLADTSALTSNFSAYFLRPL